MFLWDNTLGDLEPASLSSPHLSYLFSNMFVQSHKKKTFYSYQGLYNPREISDLFCCGHCCFATQSEVMLFERTRVTRYHPTESPSTIIAVKLVLFMLRENNI